MLTSSGLSLEASYSFGLRSFNSYRKKWQTRISYPLTEDLSWNLGMRSTVRELIIVSEQADQSGTVSEVTEGTLRDGANQVLLGASWTF